MILLMEKKKTKPVSPEEKKFNDDFGLRIKSRKEEKGLTSEKLAEMANISYQWVSTIENGRTKRGVSLYVAHRLAAALGTSIEQLIGQELEIDEDTAFEMMKRARERKKEKRSA